MKTCPICRAAVLAFAGVVLCAFVWVATTEAGPPYAANIGKLSVVLEPSPGPDAEQVRVALTNCGAGDLRLLGVEMQGHAPDGSMDYSSGIDGVTLRPKESHAIIITGVRGGGGNYRAVVSYSCELTGVRRWTHRVSKAIKKGNLNVLWDSSTTYRYGQAVVGESRL